MGETQEPVPSTSKSETKSKKSAKTIKKLKVDSDESDLEEVENGHEQTIPKEGVEVKIETTNGLKRKKTKTMDLEAIIKRRINQIRREKQVELHKASRLCHLSHEMVVNKQLNSPSLMAVALSILPSQHCYPPKKSDLNYLEKIASWFHKKVSVADVKDDPDKTLVQLLELAFQVMKAPNKRILVLMFVTLMRSLGLKTRLIISLQPLPLKPKPQDLLTVLPKPEVKLGDKKKQSIEAKKTNEKTSKANEKAPKKSKKEVKSESGPPKSKRSKKERESKYLFLFGQI
ncbi:DNA repair protein complementing XP-C cells homolog [Neocloeon triangulifer]|uniref:DNA repair protein complementing XP-C cells homolog n=1 Tax=Neocloeon triangulifer TaxID=2078957 RepID=UPI00286EFDC8|nr:DNA repair protein complementing XP-C cells homolog [Neocloeon triangulifer]XP_059468363.1 DNA repair protein complementing XP-C cells homolog [Neocloeon triangulifer]